MISKIIERKRIPEGIFGNSWTNYLTEFDLYIDIVSKVYMFFANILFSRLIGEANKKGDAQRAIKKQMIIKDGFDFYAMQPTYSSSYIHSPHPKDICLVGWGYRIHPPPMRVLDTTLNNLMGTFQ